ncbi:MAG: Ig-like domain-containing protein [Halothece sp.]
MTSDRSNPENHSAEPNNLINLVSKSILPLLVFLGTAILLFYTWTIQHSCEPLIGQPPDYCFIKNITIDFRRLPWENAEFLSLKLDEQKQLNAKLVLEKVDYPINKEVIWISSNYRVVTVDQQGKITAVAPGKAEIKASSKLSRKKSAILEVIVPEEPSEMTDVDVVESESQAS